MNKLLVVAKNPDTYFIKRLIAEVGRDSVVLFNPWDPTALGTVDRVLFRSSGVYGGDLDLEFAKSLRTPLCNPLPALETFRSKSSQYAFFERRGHPCLPWCWLEDWTPEKFPGMLLVKPDRGQGGWGIEVLAPQGLGEFKESKLSQGDPSWIVQPYYQAEEYRVFFVNEKRLTLKRRPVGPAAAANFSQHGDAEIADLPRACAAPVEALIQDSQAVYGAIDFLLGPLGIWVLELNVVPGIEQLEALTGRNLIQELLAANYFCQSR